MLMKNLISGRRSSIEQVMFFNNMVGNAKGINSINFLAPLTEVHEGRIPHRAHRCDRKQHL